MDELNLVWSVTCNQWKWQAEIRAIAWVIPQIINSYLFIQPTPVYLWHISFHPNRWCALWGKNNLNVSTWLQSSKWELKNNFVQVLELSKNAAHHIAGNSCHITSWSRGWSLAWQKEVEIHPELQGVKVFRCAGWVSSAERQHGTACC